MSFVSEFRQFALRGNVIDLAVGVIIGAAFGKIVDSIVNDLIMPIIGIVFKADFSTLYVPLSKNVPPGLPLMEARKLGPVLAWGNFITVAINFIILAFVIFMLIRGMNRLLHAKKEEPAAPAAPTNEEKLLMEIRDALKR
jgi:large conductance mechanosensitive channel